MLKKILKLIFGKPSYDDVMGELEQSYIEAESTTEKPMNSPRRISTSAKNNFGVDDEVNAAVDSWTLAVPAIIFLELSGAAQTFAKKFEELERQLEPKPTPFFWDSYYILTGLGLPPDRPCPSSLTEMDLKDLFRLNYESRAINLARKMGTRLRSEDLLAFDPFFKLLLGKVEFPFADWELDDEILNQGIDIEASFDSVIKAIVNSTIAPNDQYPHEQPRETLRDFREDDLKKKFDWHFTEEHWSMLIDRFDGYWSDRLYDFISLPEHAFPEAFTWMEKAFVIPNHPFVAIKSGSMECDESEPEIVIEMTGEGKPDGFKMIIFTDRIVIDESEYYVRERTPLDDVTIKTFLASLPVGNTERPPGIGHSQAWVFRDGTLCLLCSIYELPAALQTVVESLMSSEFYEPMDEEDAMRGFDFDFYNNGQWIGSYFDARPEPDAFEWMPPVAVKEGSMDCVDDAAADFVIEMNGEGKWNGFQLALFPDRISVEEGKSYVRERTPLDDVALETFRNSLPDATEKPDAIGPSDVWFFLDGDFHFSCSVYKIPAALQTFVETILASDFYETEEDTMGFSIFDIYESEGWD